MFCNLAGFNYIINVINLAVIRGENARREHDLLIKQREQAVRKKVEEQLRAIIHLQSGRIHGFLFTYRAVLQLCTLPSSQFLFCSNSWLVGQKEFHLPAEIKKVKS